MNYWFPYDANGNIFPRISDSQPTDWQGAMLGPYPQDTASPEIVMAATYSSRYLVVNGQLVLQPYFTLDVEASTTVANEFVLTATLNNPPAANAPTKCTFGIFDQNIDVTLVNNVAQLNVDVHPSVTAQQLNVTAKQAGCASATKNIGGNASQISLHTVVAQGKNPLIAPYGTGSKSFLGNYWTGNAINQAFVQADINTALALLIDAVFNVMLPQLTSGSIPAVTLSPNQGNALSDIKANVLGSFLTTLENAAPKPASGATQSYDFHYEHYSLTAQKVKTAMQNYANDISNLPNLA